MELINVCNYRCKHCYFYNDEYRNNLTDKKILKLESINKIVKLLRFYGLNTINLLGGEPLLVGYNYFSQLLYDLDKYNYIEAINIFTNASLIDNNFVELFRKFRKKINIFITFHSYNEKQNDEIAGYIGDFNKKKNLIHLLKKENIRVSFNTVISKYNYNDYDKIKKLASDNGSWISMDLARISSKNSYLINKEMNLDNFLINPIKAVQSYIPDIDDLVIRNKKNSCWSSSLSLDYNEDLYLCAEMHSEKTKICNIAGIKDGIEIFNSIRYKKIIHTSDCEKKCYACEFKPICLRCSTILSNKKFYNLKSICIYNPYNGELKNV